jgi:glutathione S-transferase
LPYVVQGTPRIEQALAPFLIGGVKKFISWRLDIDVAKAKRALDRVSAVFDDVGLLLADRRRYLAGDRFSAADLTFASLAAPVLLPPEYGVPMPSLDDAPPALRDQMLRFRSTPAGAFALRMYADHRSVSKAAATAGSTMHSAAERGADSAGTATAPELPR